jgi:hypothetical protein
VIIMNFSQRKGQLPAVRFRPYFLAADGSQEKITLICAPPDSSLGVLEKRMLICTRAAFYLRMLPFATLTEDLMEDEKPVFPAGFQFHAHRGNSKRGPYSVGVDIGRLCWILDVNCIRGQVSCSGFGVAMVVQKFSNYRL